MKPFTGGQSNSHVHLSSNGSNVNIGSQARSYSQVSRGSGKGPQIADQKMIESDEEFELAKNHLENKKYKEAIAGFMRSLKANPYNFDSLFYKAVSQLDFG